MTKLGVAANHILAVDTSTAQAGVAVEGDGRVSCLTWNAGRSHTVLMLDQIHRLLELHGAFISDIGAIAVAIGPGAFTGLRVGMSLAKGLVLALDLPLIGVSTLEATALPHLDGHRTVAAVVPAGRGRVVWSPFGGDFAAPHALDEPMNVDVDELVAAVARLPGIVVVTGDFDDTVAAALRDRTGAIQPTRPLRLRQPAALLAIARRRHADGSVDEAASLAPVYVGR